MPNNGGEHRLHGHAVLEQGHPLRDTHLDIPGFTPTIAASNLKVRRAGQDMRLPDAASQTPP